MLAAETASTVTQRWHKTATAASTATPRRRGSQRQAGPRRHACGRAPPLAFDQHYSERGRPEFLPLRPDRADNVETAGERWMDTAAWSDRVRPARQLVSVGETYDFEIQPTR